MVTVFRFQSHCADPGLISETWLSFVHLSTASMTVKYNSVVPVFSQIISLAATADTTEEVRLVPGIQARWYSTGGGCFLQASSGLSYIAPESWADARPLDQGPYLPKKWVPKPRLKVVELDVVWRSALSYTKPRQEEHRARSLSWEMTYRVLNPCSKSVSELDLWSGGRAL